MEDALGWIGTAFYTVSYWLHGSSRPMVGFMFAIIGAACWVGVGIMLDMPSIIVADGIAGILFMRGLWVRKDMI